MTVVLGPGGMGFDSVIAVARGGERVEISAEARERMAASRATVESLEGAAKPVYGVSTGFGALASERIPPERRSELQSALIRSHAAGLGPPVASEVVRAMMVLRARTLCMGYSGARPALAEALVHFLNHHITPCVPAYGSLGASGDLAPLAHVGVCLLGEGQVFDAQGTLTEAATALSAAGLQPFQLHNKEGLALINGTDGMLGLLVLAVKDLRLLLKTADVAAAMSIEALLGTDRPFSPPMRQLRPHPGHMQSADNLSRLLAGSGILASHRHSEHAVQDAYSLRCAPQVTGAARDTLTFSQEVAERELRSVVDNPAVLPDGTVESGGNFHGAPLGYAADFLSIASADVGAISERRTDRLLDPARSQGLPAFLAASPGVDSGLMLAGYTAAALVTENRRLAVPASTESIPTSGMQEDHVSMGWSAGLKLRASLENLAGVLAVEVLAGAYGLHFRRPLDPAPATSSVRDLVLGEVGTPGPDRFTSPLLKAVERLVVTGQIVAAAEVSAGQLG